MKKNDKLNFINNKKMKIFKKFKTINKIYKVLKITYKRFNKI